MRLVLSAVLVCAGACAAAPQTARIRAHDTPVRPAAAQPTPEAHDDAWLFHAAGDAQRAGDMAVAEQYYGELLRDAPTSPLAGAARFNLGLVLEQRRAYAEAAEVYLPLITAPLPVGDEARRTWIDAHYRRAACLAQSSRWDEVSQLFDVVLATDELTLADRIEALVGRGIADQERGATSAAESAFSQVLHRARDFDRDAGIELGAMVAEAAFHWGDIERARFEGVTLAFPTKLLAERLEEKCEKLLRAQRRYLSAMRFGDAHTVAAAGNRIGGMYEGLHAALMALEIPPHLDAEQRVVYRDEVRKRLKVLAEKAIKVYERTALVGKRADSAGTWVEKSEMAVARLRAIVLDEGAL